MIFINPWASYDKEDMPPFNYADMSIKEINKSMRNLLLVMIFITIFLWVITVITGFIGGCVIATSIVTIVTLYFLIIYILDLWKEKKKHSGN